MRENQRKGQQGHLPWGDSPHVDPTGLDSPKLRSEGEARTYSVPPALEREEQYEVTLLAVKRWWERNVRPNE